MGIEAPAMANMRRTGPAFYRLPEQKRFAVQGFVRREPQELETLPPVGTFEMVPFFHDRREHYIAREVVTGDHIRAFMEATNHLLPAPDFALARWLTRYNTVRDPQDVRPADELSMRYVHDYIDWYNSHWHHTNCRVGLPSLAQLEFVYSNQPQGFVPSPQGELTSDMRGSAGILRYPNSRIGYALSDEPYDPETFTFRLIGQFIQ